MDVKLTQYARGAGCGCKIAPAVLQQMLTTEKVMPASDKLLVGYGTADDAAVYDMGNGMGLVSTTDFFMPIVDDPYDFGRIAAANAISDVYAMGGTPIMALAILGFPIDQLPVEVASAILDGARAICIEAGIPLAGGHTIDTTEPVFGLAVTGTVAIANLKRNNTPIAGDHLLLTKPLGTGILATAGKKGLIDLQHHSALVAQMATLNSVGAALGTVAGVHAMTDVTGFGLAGHLTEMVQGSGCSAELFYSKIGVMDGVRDYLKQRAIPDATYRNWNSFGKAIHFEPGVDVMEAFSLLPDPQTNGGLLIAVAENALTTVQGILEQHGLHNFTTPVGKIVPAWQHNIIVRP